MTQLAEEMRRTSDSIEPLHDLALPKTQQEIDCDDSTNVRCSMRHSVAAGLGRHVGDRRCRHPLACDEANYRVPRREYVAVPGEWRIYAERSLVEGDSNLAAAAEES